MSPSDLGTQSKDLFLLQEEAMELPDGNDLAVLEALAQSFENIGALSFQGIRRKLGLHQETLSRSLRRLERDGLVDKSHHEYKISKKGEELLTQGKSDHSIDEITFPIPILRAILPPDATNLELERVLSRKWFGSLRWYGSSHDESGTILSWITDDGRLRLSVRVSSGYLTIESQATAKESMQAAIGAAYDILGQVSRILKSKPMIPHSEQTRSLYRAA